MTDHGLRADRLLAARDTGTAVPADPDLDLATGYGVADELARRLVGRGWVRRGRKIGFTNRTTWAVMGLDAPMWAPVWDRTLHEPADPRAVTVALDGTREVRLEPEVVIGLAADLPDGPLTADDVAARVAWAALGFELVDNHHDHWPVTPGEAVADFGLHHALVLGPRLPSTDPAALRDLRVVLRREDAPAGALAGSGRDVLGGPLDALAHLPSLPGAAPVRAGEVVTTGTLVAPPVVTANQRWSVSVNETPWTSLALR